MTTPSGRRASGFADGGAAHTRQSSADRLPAPSTSTLSRNDASWPKLAPGAAAGLTFSAPPHLLVPVERSRASDVAVHV
jgi:hypothetical protein